MRQGCLACIPAGCSTSQESTAHRHDKHASPWGFTDQVTVQIAKLVALSWGQTELKEEHWEHMRHLEHQRAQRLRLVARPVRSRTVCFTTSNCARAAATEPD